MIGFPRNMTNVPIEDPSGNGQFDRMWTDPFPPGNGDPSQSLSGVAARLVRAAPRIG
jgi:hypothetical protein